MTDDDTDDITPPIGFHYDAATPPSTRQARLHRSRRAVNC